MAAIKPTAAMPATMAAPVLSSLSQSREPA
jgi:hypothetical protein